MRARMGFLPRVMRGAAGPHDLGPGQNHDSAFPELAARPDRAPDVEYDAISGHEAQNLVPEEDDSQQNIIVHNTPDV